MERVSYLVPPFATEERVRLTDEGADNALNRLARQTHSTGNLRHRQRPSF